MEENVKKYLPIILLITLLILGYVYISASTSSYPKGVEKIVLRFDHPIIIETYYSESWGPWLDELTLVIKLLKPRIEKELLFYIRVYNLTENGAVKIAEICTLKDTATIQIKMWKKLLRIDKKEEKITKQVKIHGVTVNQTIGERIIYLPVFQKYGIFVYAIAYDENLKKIYTASWSASLDPYYNKTTYVSLHIKVLGSRYVYGENVPEPGQTKTEYKTGPNICAINIPEYVKYLYNIPVGMSVYCSVKKKSWYMVEGEDPTDPNSLWEEEDWENSGTTIVTIDHSASSGWTSGPVSLTWYVHNVKVVHSTVAETTPLYHVMLLSYAVDRPNDDRVSSRIGFPSGSKSLINTIARGDSGEYPYDFATVYYVRVGPFTITLGAIIGGGAKVSISGSVSFDIKVDRGYFKIKVPDWSQVPSQYNCLKVYEVGGKKSQIKAEFSG
ncbi:MAG: hypothetical protein DRN04_03510 [Thermoprotei archaeon]|nr:MAG: hypothetical protein DRN04_03510 [Thermoprotei archaeon]